MPKPTSSFVPKGYEVKSGGSDFLKLATGDNKLRILTDAVIGKEGWKDNKPFRRVGEDAEISPSEVDVDAKTGKPKINDFMAFYVYNHNEGKIMVAAFTQAGIRKTLVEYANDPEWGHPSGYDITITKTGEGFSTKYSMKPSPAKALPASIQKEIELEEEFFDLEKALGIEE